jgi:hypothetical protein
VAAADAVAAAVVTAADRTAGKELYDGLPSPSVDHRENARGDMLRAFLLRLSLGVTPETGAEAMILTKKEFSKRSSEHVSSVRSGSALAGV